MQTKGSQEVISRFFHALDLLSENGTIDGGINAYCKRYNIDKRNLYKQKNDLTRSIFQVSWMLPLVNRYHVSPQWLLTGYGSMFFKRRRR